MVKPAGSLVAKTEAASSARASPAAKWDSPFWEPGPWAEVFSRMEEEDEAAEGEGERVAAGDDKLHVGERGGGALHRDGAGGGAHGEGLLHLAARAAGGRGDGEGAGVSGGGERLESHLKNTVSPTPGPTGGPPRGLGDPRSARAGGGGRDPASAREYRTRGA